MNRQTRVRREAREDPLWAAVWQIWPKALLFEDDTPFDVLRHNGVVSEFRRRQARERRHIF